MSKKKNIGLGLFPCPSLFDIEKARWVNLLLPST